VALTALLYVGPIIACSGEYLLAVRFLTKVRGFSDKVHVLAALIIKQALLAKCVSKTRTEMGVL